MSPRSLRIKTLFRSAALVFALLCIVVAIGFYNAFGIYQKSLSREAFAGIVNQSAYRLTSLTGNYLVYRENRARQQWVSVHQNLEIALRQRITQELTEGNADDGAISEIMVLNDRLGKLFALTVKYHELDKSADAGAHKPHARGDRFASQVLSVSHQITSKADLILQQSRETVRQLASWAWAIMVAGLLLLILFTVGAWIFFHRRIAIPIQKLRDDIGTFRDDKLRGYVRSVNDDEIGEVANEFNRISESLRESMVSRDELTQEMTEHIIAKEKLQIATQLLDESQKVAMVGGWQLDIASRDLFWTDETYHIHDTSPSEFNPAVDAGVGYYLPESRQIISDALDAALKDGIGYDLELELLTTKGRKIDVRTTCRVTRENGKSTKLVGIFQDITERKLSEEKLKLAASVFTHAREGITITDAAGAINEVNDTFSHITGYTREEVLGKNPRFLHSGRQSSEFYAEMWKSLLEKGFWKGEVWNRRKSGEVYAELLTISTVKNATGLVQNYVGLFSDITQLKDHQNQLEHIAHHDILTNLPNRVLLADRLSQAMVQCQRRNRSLAVAFLDLDGFKVVNDTHGHHVGDELLIAVSQRLKEALREGDTLARIGGDEFIAVLVDLEKIGDSEPVLERLLKAAAEPVAACNVVMQVSVSIGVTLYPQDGVDADQLMRHADQAMYVAKQAGKNRYHLFDTAQNDAIKVQRESLEAIRSALDNQQFVLHYQPKVNMHTGDVIGAEALIRWQHPERGLVPPLDFLPTIEGHSISLELGEWVIDTALSQMSQWPSIGINLPISVNISAYQLQQDNFITRLSALLAAYPDINPHHLELEILETSELSDISQVSATMNACHELGVRFALDDFGTGYSSLTYLRRLPAHMIKIDQSFVRDMLEDTDDLAIVEGVIGLAKAFRREVIAEGVETIAHGTELLLLGCELAQGYGIARPMPADDIPQWISSWKVDDPWRETKHHKS